MRIFVAVLLLAAAAAAAEDEVRLKNGDKIHGKIVHASSVSIVIDHPDLGRLTISRSQVESYTGQDATPRITKDGSLSRDIDDLAANKPKSKWKGSLTLGGIYTNDDDGKDFRLTTRASGVRKTERSNWRLLGSWIIENDDGVQDTNTFFVTTSFDFVRKKGMRRYWWIEGRYDHDDFRSWDQRVTGHFGIGYRFVQTEKTLVAGLIGVGGRKEWGSPGNPLSVEGAGGFSIFWHPRERQTLSLTVMAYPTIEDPNSRVVTTFDWKVLLDRKAGLSFNTHVDWEWDTQPDPGFPENTVRWTWGLQLDF